jgi:hypothetical protein
MSARFAMRSRGIPDRVEIRGAVADGRTGAVTNIDPVMVLCRISPAAEPNVQISERGRLHRPSRAADQPDFCPLREFIAERGRKQYPRKSNVTFGYDPLRLSVLQ